MRALVGIQDDARACDSAHCERLSRKALRGWASAMVRQRVLSCNHGKAGLRVREGACLGAVGGRKVKVGGEELLRRVGPELRPVVAPRARLGPPVRCRTAQRTLWADAINSRSPSVAERTVAAPWGSHRHSTAQPQTMQQHNVFCNTGWQLLRDPNAVVHTTSTANVAFAALRLQRCVCG